MKEYTVADFQLKLSHETQERCLMGMILIGFDGNDVHKIFKSFLNIFLTIYYTICPLFQAKNKINQNSGIIPGIITACNIRDKYKGFIE